MGTPTLLGKITTGIAIVFTLTSFTLAMLGGERGSSVVRERRRRLRRVPRPTGSAGRSIGPSAPTIPAAPTSPESPAPQPR